MSQAEANTQYYRRFSFAQRCLHGTVMATFIGLAWTGMTLRFSQAVWALAFARAVGGFTAILFFHKFCGVILTVAFFAHLGDIFYHGIVKREKGFFWGPRSMIPQPQDVRDLYNHFRWFLWLGPRPQFDHFAYWEKFDYWAVFWGMAIIGLSGYFMWFVSFFTKFLPGSWLNIALLLHGEEALLAVWFIFTVHFFNTHFRPGSFPMDLVFFTGRLSEKELMEKHPAEYARLLESGQLQAARSTAPPERLKTYAWVIGFTVVATGFVLLWLTVTSFLKGM